MIRFRTEAFSGSGERNALEVIRYEIFELGNTDILTTLSTTILKSHPIRPILERYVWEIDENGFVDDLSEQETRSFVKRILEAVGEETGYTVNYALWLADRATVQWFYHGTEDNISAYSTGAVVLSELGCDGTLYGYDKLPEEIEIE